MSYFLGIDPGALGGIAILGSKHVETVEPLRDLTDDDIRDIIQPYHDMLDVFAILEKVQPMPRSACGNVPMFKLGTSYGFLRGLLTAYGIPRQYVRAQVWQKHFGLIKTSKNETQTQKKNRHKAVAQELYPKIKVTHGTADALLIATYAREIRNKL